MSDQKSLAKELVEAGVIFGQRRSNWNPRMKPYIFATKNGISIIDIKETIKGLLLARKFIAKTVASGKDVCFVGTKRQARAAVEQYCAESKMPFVTERWLGGTLTNFRTIRERLRRLEELERLAETGDIRNYSKKMESQLAREQKKIFRNLHGLRTMTKLPGALVVVDTNREMNALLEAKALGIPTICLIDTDGNPDLADIPIPGNDDSMRSIDIVIRELCSAATEGRGERKVVGRHEHRGPRRRTDADRRHDRRGLRRIDRREGLVKQQHAARSMLVEGAGHGHPLLLAAAHLRKGNAGAPGEPDRTQRLPGAAWPCPGGRRAKRNHLECREGRADLRPLHHHRNRPGPLGWAHRVDRHAAERHPAPPGHGQSGGQAEGGGLAAAVGPKQHRHAPRVRTHLAGLERKPAHAQHG